MLRCLQSLPGRCLGPAFVCLGLMSGQVRAAEFVGPWAADWRFLEQGSACILEQRVSDYGVARFIGAFGEPLLFEVVGHRDLMAAGPVAVQRVAPPWHPAFPQREDLARLDHLPSFNLTASDAPALQLLLSLYEGFDAQLREASVYAEDESILLTVHAVRLRPHYEAFVACYRGERAKGWHDLRRSRVFFAVDDHTLRPAAEQRLRDIAAYVQATPSIAGVFVDGHTDSTAGDAINYPLSKRRAQTVRRAARRARRGREAAHRALPRGPLSRGEQRRRPGPPGQPPHHRAPGPRRTGGRHPLNRAARSGDRSAALAYHSRPWAFLGVERR